MAQMTPHKPVPAHLLAVATDLRQGICTIGARMLSVVVWVECARGWVEGQGSDAGRTSCTRKFSDLDQALQAGKAIGLGGSAPRNAGTVFESVCVSQVFLAR